MANLILRFLSPLELITMIGPLLFAETDGRLFAGTNGLDSPPSSQQWPPRCRTNSARISLLQSIPADTPRKRHFRVWLLLLCLKSGRAMAGRPWARRGWDAGETNLVMCPPCRVYRPGPSFKEVAMAKSVRPMPNIESTPSHSRFKPSSRAATLSNNQRCRVRYTASLRWKPRKSACLLSVICRDATTRITGSRPSLRTTPRPACWAANMPPTWRSG